jgi:phosphoribosylformylglycinamidine cyclo-ligase
MSHITGGGFFENIPRMLKDGQGVEIEINSFPRPKVFDLIQETGNIPQREMYNVFNMGIGFIMAVENEDVNTVLSLLSEINEPAYVIGKVTNSGEVDLKW